MFTLRDPDGNRLGKGRARLTPLQSRRDERLCDVAVAEQRAR